MKEILMLNFGNYSNFVFCHFINLNDEILKSQADAFNLNSNIIFDDYNRPRALLFDYSENIRKYYNNNEQISEEDLKGVKDSLISSSHDPNKIQVSQTSPSRNNFLDFMCEIEKVPDSDQKKKAKEKTEDDFEDEKDYEEYKKWLEREKRREEEENVGKISDKLEKMLNLGDDELYEYFDFNSSIHSWNDFLKPHLPSSSLNEIKTSDYDEALSSSYLRGYSFLQEKSRRFSYFETFEDNFRRKLEDCDCISFLNFNVDFNGFWGGINGYFGECVEDMVVKVGKVMNGWDFKAEFYGKNDEGERRFDAEKFVNYIFFFSHLQDLYGSNLLFNIQYLNAPSTMYNLFNYDTTESNLFTKDSYSSSTSTLPLDGVSPAFKFYHSSLSALQLQNLFLPFRNKNYGKKQYVNDLALTSSESAVNFFEGDMSVNLEVGSGKDKLENNDNKSSNTLSTNTTLNSINSIKTNNKIPNTSGFLCNFSRDLNSQDFSWEKLLKKSVFLGRNSTSVLIGVEKGRKYALLGEDLTGCLNKMSHIVFNLSEKYLMPMAFPRKIYWNVGDKREFDYKEKLSLWTNHRPYLDFCLKTLKNFKQDLKCNDMQIKKILSKIDQDAIYDLKDKAENIHNMIYIYQDLAEERFNEFHNDQSSEEEEDI